MSTASTRPRFVDVAEDAGITYRQADHWCRRGYIHTRDGDGSGNPRLIDDDEIRVLQTMARLVHAGFTPPAAAKLARAETGRTDHTLADGIYLIITDPPPPEPEPTCACHHDTGKWDCPVHEPREDDGEFEPAGRPVATIETGTLT